MRRATVKKIDVQNSTGAAGVRWLDVDDVIQNILGPESAYLRGHQQPDNPPTFARGPDADEESNESTQSVFVQENILSVAGI